MDTTGLSALDEIVADFQRLGTRVVLCQVRANALEKLERARILARVGPSGVYRTLSEFLATHKLDAAEGTKETDDSACFLAIPRRYFFEIPRQIPPRAAPVSRMAAAEFGRS